MKKKSVEAFPPSMVLACPYPGCGAGAGDLCVFNGRSRLSTHHVRRKALDVLRTKCKRLAKARRLEWQRTLSQRACPTCGKKGENR